MDILPGKWVGIEEHEREFKKKLLIGDFVKVIVDSQFQDKYSDGEKLPRRINQIGKVIKIDHGDEWAYNLEFSDEGTNWFKRYHLQKCN